MRTTLSFRGFGAGLGVLGTEPLMPPGKQLTFSQRLAKAPAFRQVKTSVYSVSADTVSSANWRVEADAVLAAYEDVRARLSEFDASPRLNSAKAWEAMKEMSAWANDNGASIAAFAKANPDAPAPEALVAKLPADKAQQFVVLSLFDAGYGLELYRNGRVEELLAEGTWDVGMVQRDLAGRRAALQMLTAMHEDGTIGRIFAAGSYAGLGLDPITIAAIVVVACFFIGTAGYLIYRYLEGQTESKARWERIDAECKDAKEKKDAKRQETCLKILAEQPKHVDPMETAVKYGAIALVTVFFLQFTLPKVIAMWGNRDRS